MKRLLLVTSLLAAVASVGCSPRYDVFTTWTINGFPAAEACQKLADPRVTFLLENRDVEGGAVVEAEATAPCVDGNALLAAGSFSEITVDLFDGETRFGGAGPIAVSPGSGAYEGQTAEDAVPVNIELERGRLQATLTVVGQSCADAGATDFSVTLLRQTSPLGKEIVVDDVAVSCNVDGVAVFEHAPVEVGSTYEVRATATIDGVEYATSDEDAGEGALIEDAVTDLTVDLDVIGRP